MVNRVDPKDSWSCSGLYSSASQRQSSGSGIGAIVRPRIEGNRRAWGNLTNSVDDHFEQCKIAGRQAHAGSDDHTIVVRRTELTLHGRSGGFVRADKTNVGLPSAFSELLQRNRDAGVKTAQRLLIDYSAGRNTLGD